MRLFGLVLALCLVPALAQAQSVDLAQVSAQGVAIYGWHNGVATVLYEKKQGYLFPVASITKLVTAKAVEQLYPDTASFTISQEAMTDIQESNSSIAAGMALSRDDLLRTLLIGSNNGAGKQFALSAPPNAFITAMNNFLHANKYTTTSFINPTGLDPTTKGVLPNRLTPHSVSYLLSDIFQHDPLLTSILETKGALITDQATAKQIQLTSSDELNYDPLYNFFVILGKTGTTNLAGQDLAFVTNGGTKFDYVTIVFMHSKNRYQDGQVILNWLQQVLSYQS